MRYATIAALWLGGAAMAQDTSEDIIALAEEAGIGGLGLAPCRDVTGPENAPLLAQAGDWMLGYMAGRIDAGETLVEGEPLSAASSIDIVTSIATFCVQNPDATVLGAARRYGQRVFGTEPVDRQFEDAPSEVPRPAARPESIEEEAAEEETASDADDTETTEPADEPAAD